MSEYQYYEFQAIDRPLSDADMRALRSFSTRARITRTSFVNEYQWGSFKGDEDAWMAKYFDAFLYYANWNTRIVKLRVPAGVIAAATARRYCRSGALGLRKTATHLIFTFASDDDSGAEDDLPDATLSSFVPLRQDLVRGDIRALYLGWLLSVQAGERDENAREPPVPAGLSDLSAPLASLVDFFRLDGELLTVAARASSNPAPSGPGRHDVAAWVGSLSKEEKDDIITEILSGGDPSVTTRLLARFHKHLRRSAASATQPARRSRTVGELLAEAKALREERERRVEMDLAAAEARRVADEARARERYLDGITPKSAQVWIQVETLVASTKPANYAKAL